jgi:hypothetical protein
VTSHDWSDDLKTLDGGAMLGAGFLFPMNAFITAVDYFYLY